MDFYALGRIMPLWRVCLYSTKQQETKNIVQSKRTVCPEFEKRNFNVDRGVVAAGAAREKERDEKKLGIL